MTIRKVLTANDIHSKGMPNVSNARAMTRLAAFAIGIGSCLAAQAATIVSETWEQENLGNTQFQLANWTGVGGASNAVLVDSDPGPGINKALKLASSTSAPTGSGIKHSLDLTGAPGVTVQFDWTNVQPVVDSFGSGVYLYNAATGGSYYRFSWSGTSTNILIRKKTTGSETTIGNVSLPGGFNWQDANTLEFRLLFEESDNTLEVRTGGSLLGTVTNNVDPLSPHANWRIEMGNVVGGVSGTGLNLLDNIVIATVPEPAGLGFLSIGIWALTRRSRRK